MQNPFRKMKKILKNDGISLFFCLALALLIVFAIYWRSGTDWINTTILALTAFVILWYTRETAAMKALVAKQNHLQTRPIVTMVLGKGSPPLLKNEGKGPAVNSCVGQFIAQSSFRPGAVSTENEYKFLLPAYIPQDSTCEFKMFRADKDSGIKGTISEPDIINQMGKVITITIKYEDIEGTPYSTHFQIQSGRVMLVSFNST